MALVEATNNYLVTARDLQKKLGSHLASNHIQLNIPRGGIFGLLGPNGAGKTTLIRMITGILKPDAGSIHFEGSPLEFRHSAQIGYMPEERGLYKGMKVAEQLIYLGKLKGLSSSSAREKVKYWLNRLEIGSWENKRVEELSKGMSQKVQFIATVLHEPKLIILDEPFSGLDPINARIIEEEIRNLNRQGSSIVFSTHRMEQVEEICEDIALINKGRMILDGKVKLLKKSFKKNIYKAEFEGTLPALNVDGIQLIEQGDDKAIFKIESEHSSGLLRWLSETGLNIHSVKEVLPSLNDIFIQTVEKHNAE